jgi:transcriptional regulator with XRE-family HTH domain
MTHPVDTHVGKRIRHRRWMNGTTQQQLAHAVGIKFQQIQKYETGANRVSASRLHDIGQAFGVPVVWFFEGMDGAAAAMPEIDREAGEMLRAVAALSPAQKRAVLDLARSMAKEVAA